MPAVYSDTVTAPLGLLPFSVDSQQTSGGNPASPISLLIRHLRAVSKATLTDLTNVVEGLSATKIGETGGLQLDFLVLVGQQPREDEGAVNDWTQVLPVDFVLVRKTVQNGTTDTTQTVRDDLKALQDAILRDHRQGGAANRTELVRTPLDRVNQYQQHFADLAQGITVMVLTCEFWIVESVLVL